MISFGILEVLSRHLSGETEEKPQIISVSISGSPSEIRTDHPTNTSLRQLDVHSCIYTNLRVCDHLSLYVIKMLSFTIRVYLFHTKDYLVLILFPHCRRDSLA
jgi:hypothetical protein